MSNKLILRFLRFSSYEATGRAGWNIRVIKSLIYFTPVQLCLKKKRHTSFIITARECMSLFPHISILITFEQLIKIIYHSLEQHVFRCTLSNEYHEYSNHVHFNKKK